MKTPSIVLATVLLTLSASPLLARQAPAADTTAIPPAAQASVASTGPRVRQAPATVPAFGESREPVVRRDVHTLRVTTLVLVLGIIILVLLIT